MCPRGSAGGPKLTGPESTEDHETRDQALSALINLGILVYLVLTVFQLVTLPVEFDASRRAKRALATLNIVDRDEAEGVSKTLDAAGFTYVAAFIASLANLIYLILISRR